MITPSLRAYVEEAVLPRYALFDRAHSTDHVGAVISRSMALARHYDVEEDMVYVVAAYHDLGLPEGRADHHLTSARLLRDDPRLREWFSDGQVELMAEAVEDHRASLDRSPRTIYGRIVAEADRLIDVDTVLRRTVQYGLANYPQLDTEGHWRRFCDHLAEKYAEGGYLRLWIPESDNGPRLAELRRVIADPEELRRRFEAIFLSERSLA